MLLLKQVKFTARRGVCIKEEHGIKTIIMFQHNVIVSFNKNTIL